MKMNLLNSAYLFNNADRYIDNVARRVSNTFRCRKVTFPRSTFVMTCKSVIYNVI